MYVQQNICTANKIAFDVVIPVKMPYYLCILKRIRFNWCVNLYRRAVTTSLTAGGISSLVSISSEYSTN